MTTESTAKPRRPKFKHTRELVRIAVQQGMSQDDIARECRVSQSVVSDWFNGKGKASEPQMAPLLKRYGHRLNRTTARVYLVRDEARPRWEETDIGRQLVELRAEKERPGSSLEGSPFVIVVGVRSGQTEEKPDPHAQRVAALAALIMPPDHGTTSVHGLISWYAEEHQTSCLKVVQVEGTVIFRHTFHEFEGRQRRNDIEAYRVPVGRWLVHQQPRGTLCLVTQERRLLSGRYRDQWFHGPRGYKILPTLPGRDEVRDAGGYRAKVQVPWVDSPEDAGRWLSYIRQPISVEDLLTLVDSHLKDPEAIHSPHDELVLPFLLRKALLEHGHPVPGVERITGME